MISKLYFWMIFNRYSRIEEDRGTGEQGGERAGSGNYLRAESGSRNKKGTRLLFIAAYNPVKNQFLANFFDFHLTRRKKISKKMS